MAGNQLPIKRLTLYKHGVGFVEREGTVGERQVQLVFRQDEVNDALKSLLVLDRSGGAVQGIHYETPTTEQTQSKIQLSDDNSVLDLLKSLRGQQVRVSLGEGTTASEHSGQLIGVDIDTEKPLSNSLLSLLLDKEGENQVLNFSISNVRGIELLEERAGQDLRFFLDSSRNDEAHRTVTLQLAAEPAEHELLVSYLIPSPTWRVSYRLVAETAKDEDDTSKAEGVLQPQKGDLLLQGWGLFDNRLEEDLEGVKVKLVAGQPISFIYDLATSHIPHRPTVKDEARVAAGPVEFDALTEYETSTFRGFGGQSVAMDAMMPMMAAAPAPPAAPGGLVARKSAISRQEMAQQPAAAQGAAKGELFQYEVIAPVTVKRGESALVPILSQDLPYKHELLYNGRKLADHPVAALKFKNNTSLVLERGPVTILEDGEYRGEALVPFTPDGSEVYLAYAVELGIKIKEDVTSYTETVGISVSNAYFYMNQATITTNTYQFENNLDKGKVVTIEHPIKSGNDLYETGKPDETTGDYYRWNVPCKSRTITKFVVKERYYNWRTETVMNQSFDQLRQYLEKRWLDTPTYNAIVDLLNEQSEINRAQNEINELENERNNLYKRQEQLRQNMAALATSGAEADFRKKVFTQLEQTEERLAEIDKRQKQLKDAIKTAQKKMEKVLANLKMDELR